MPSWHSPTSLEIWPISMHVQYAAITFSFFPEPCLSLALCFFLQNWNASCDKSADRRRKKREQGRLLVWRMAHATVRHLCLAAKSADSGNSRITRGKFCWGLTVLPNHYLSCFYWNDRRPSGVFSRTVSAKYSTVSEVDVSLLFGPLCCRRFPSHGTI